jgi:hypothetical protein
VIIVQDELGATLERACSSGPAALIRRPARQKFIDLAGRALNQPVSGIRVRVVTVRRGPVASAGNTA